MLTDKKNKTVPPERKALLDALDTLKIRSFTENENHKKEISRKWEDEIFWVKIIGFSLPVIAAGHGFFGMWSEPRPIAAFAEIFITWILYYITFSGSVLLGIFSGRFLLRRSLFKSNSKNTVIAFACGAIITVIIFLISTNLVSRIPGIGWRLNKIYESQDDPASRVMY